MAQVSLARAWAALGIGEALGENLSHLHPLCEVVVSERTDVASGVVRIGATVNGFAVKPHRVDALSFGRFEDSLNAAFDALWTACGEELDRQIEVAIDAMVAPLPLLSR